MWSPCKVHVTSCCRRSASCQRSFPRGVRPVRVTRDAKRSHVKLIAHQMREKLQQEWENGKGVLCSPLQAWHQHFGLVLPLNETISDNRAGGHWFYTEAATASYLWQNPGRWIKKSLCLKCICMVNRSRPLALVAFILLICKPLHSWTNFPPKLFSMDDPHWLRGMRIFLSVRTCAHIFPVVYHFSMSFLMNLRPHQVISVSNHKPQ